MLARNHRKLLLQKEFIIYLLPPLLIISCYLVFHFFTMINGRQEGYLLGMIFYWLVGCVLPAFLWISKTNRKLLFRITRVNWWQITLLVIPVTLAVFFGPVRQRLHETTVLIMILSLPYAFVNAFCEELLWRGLFFVHHPGNFFYAAVVPSIWFGIWHYAPLSVQSASIGNLYFILAEIGLGLCWGAVTYHTRSIFWSLVSHTLVDFFGLAVLFYFSK
jgi:membrane protease YdiL (CAAX protease family)